MPVKSVRVYTLALILSDVFAILAAFTIAYILRVQIDSRPLVTEIGALEFVKIFFLLTPFWLLTFLGLELYSPRIYNKRMKEIGKLFIGSFLGILLVIGFAFVVDFPVFPARLVAVYAAILTFILLVVGREILRYAKSVAFRFGRGIQRVMVIGDGEVATNIARDIAGTEKSGFNVVAVCGSKVDLKGAKKFQSLDSALKALEELDIDTIIHTKLFEEELKNRKVFEAAQTHHIGYSFVPSEVELYSGKNAVDVLSGYPIISVSQTPLIGWGEVGKRLFDIVGASLGLVIAAPIIFVVGAIIKLTNRGPLIYKHQRVGWHGKPFWTYKLRSMYMRYSTGKAASGKTDEQIFKEMGREDLIEEFKQNQKVAFDPRIMPIGRFIRATSLDELPQLWNILRGDLSLVGPRPIVKDELRHYKEFGSIFLSVKPGLTGLWQVSGRSDLDYAERVNLDIYYVQNWSFWLDIKILLRTIVVVLKKTGAK